MGHLLDGVFSLIIIWFRLWFVDQKDLCQPKLRCLTWMFSIKKVSHFLVKTSSHSPLNVSLIKKLTLWPRCTAVWPRPMAALMCPVPSTAVMKMLSGFDEAVIIIIFLVTKKQIIQMHFSSACALYPLPAALLFLLSTSLIRLNRHCAPPPFTNVAKSCEWVVKLHFNF